MTRVGVGSTAQPQSVNPITLEIVRNALYSIAEEMSVIVMRSARSPLLKEAGDFSSALADASGGLIAQGPDIPIHLGVMAFTVKEFLKRVPVELLSEGDVWCVNLPEVGGNHLPDVKVLRPVFFDGRIVAFAISLAHWADIGGATPGSYTPSARDCYAEGIRIPPTRLFSRDGPDREKLEFLLANVRGRDERLGDLMAQYAATDVAARRLQELFEKYGVALVLASFERLHDDSESQMRAAIRALPDGVWEGEDWIDDDGVGGHMIPVRVRIEIRGDEATFDFEGTGEALGCVNTTYFVTRSAVAYAMKAFVAPEVTPNDGCFRPLKVRVPLGSILSPAADRPVVGGNHETSQRVVDSIVKALSHVIPDRVPAGGPTTACVCIFGGRLSDGRWWVLYETHGGGEGATAYRDGAPATRVHLGNAMNTPTEAIESEYPLLVDEHSLLPGSGGDGRWRGGLGFRRVYRIVAGDVSLTTMVDRRLVPPYGLFGGAPGVPFRILLRDGDAARELNGKETVQLQAGQVVVVETCGGGGYGPPAQRDALARERDRDAGYC